jgi:uncharacterized Zn finger protein (UPF0148 family)
MNQPLPSPKWEKDQIFCEGCGEVLVNTRPGEMQCANCGGRVFSVRKVQRSKPDPRQVFLTDPRQSGPL